MRCATWLLIVVITGGCGPLEDGIGLSADVDMAPLATHRELGPHEYPWRPERFLPEPPFERAPDDAWPGLEVFADRHALYPAYAQGAGTLDLVVEATVTDSVVWPTVIGSDPTRPDPELELARERTIEELVHRHPDARRFDRWTNAVLLDRHLLVVARDDTGGLQLHTVCTRMPGLCRGQCFPPRMPAYELDHADLQPGGAVELFEWGDDAGASYSMIRGRVWRWEPARPTPPDLWEAWVYATVLLEHAADRERDLHGIVDSVTLDEQSNRARRCLEMHDLPCYMGGRLASLLSWSMLANDCAANGLPPTAPPAGAEPAVLGRGPVDVERFFLGLVVAAAQSGPPQITWGSTDHSVDLELLAMAVADAGRSQPMALVVRDLLLRQDVDGFHRRRAAGLLAALLLTDPALSGEVQPIARARTDGDDSSSRDWPDGDLLLIADTLLGPFDRWPDAAALIHRPWRGAGADDYEHAHASLRWIIEQL